MISIHKNTIFQNELSVQNVVLNFRGRKRVTEAKLLE